MSNNYICYTPVTTLIASQFNMLNIDNKTIGEIFTEAVKLWPNELFFISPRTNESPKFELSYSAAFERVKSYENSFTKAGYGYGERVALLVGNRVDHYLIKLAANNLGMSIVPLNPDSSPDEVLYILNDSNTILTITDEPHIASIRPIAELTKNHIKIYNIDDISRSFPICEKKYPILSINPKSEASLLYTSGTTGHPKGCILSHEYELMCGDSYRSIGPPVKLKINSDRIFNPLPSFHINAGVLTFFASILTGNCLVQPMRFSASTWWRDIEETKATVFHYLGVVIAVILKKIKKTNVDLSSLRVGLGAGVEPALHEEFENFFQVPLIEVWGMTEMCRLLAVNEEPRLIHTRAMGRPRPDLEVRVINENGIDLPIGSPGEMIVRHSEACPRKGAFSGYLGNEEATEYTWRGGWFHTGDTVVMDQSKMLYFIDRQKNIIRRAGENIAAAEIENCILQNDVVLSVACIAVPDELREEEVLACIVLKNKNNNKQKTADTLFNHVYEKLAYFKAPGWILFIDKLPTTGTQKVLKHKIFSNNENPITRPDVFDLRKFKIRKNHK